MAKQNFAWCLYYHFLSFMSMRIKIYSLLLLSFACEKISYYPDRETEYNGTAIIGHRGSGSFTPDENTLAGARTGLMNMDGIELDVQLSKDRTLWIAHDAVFNTCNDIEPPCFAEATDEQIVMLDSCNGNEVSFSKLEDVFRMIHEEFPGKYISLDVKAWAPCKYSSLDIIGEMNVIGDEIIRLIKKYNLHHQVMVESETTTFLKYIMRRDKDVQCYLCVNGDFERGMLIALEAGCHGISFKYKFDEEITGEHIQLLHKKGLRIQLYVVNKPEDIVEAIAMKPDFIQTDNFQYFEYN